MPPGGIGEDSSAGIPRDVWAIIILSLAILLVGIVFTGLSTQPVRTRIPSLQATIDNQSTLITIVHQGGDSLQTGGFMILVDGVDQTANFTNSGPWPWSAGETLSYNASRIPHSAIMLYKTSNGDVVLFSPRGGHPPPPPSSTVLPSTPTVSVQNTSVTAVPNDTGAGPGQVVFEIQDLRRNPKNDTLVATLSWHPNYTGKDDRIQWYIWLAPVYSVAYQYVDNFWANRTVDPDYSITRILPGNYTVLVKGYVSDAKERTATLKINITDKPHPVYPGPL